MSRKSINTIIARVLRKSPEEQDMKLLEEWMSESEISRKGVKSQIQLPDGTRVWPNAESRISYPEDFTNSERLVSLQGEAYFEVVKDEKRPLLIRLLLRHFTLLIPRTYCLIHVKE